MASVVDPPLVLIVDDDERNRKLARDVLEAAGFRILEAASGAEAIALAEEYVPAVVLMDLRLPDIDGAEAARILKDEPRTAAIPILAVTAIALDDEREWLARAGFAGYLEKPIDVERFPDEVRRHCRGVDFPGNGMLAS